MADAGLLRDHLRRTVAGIRPADDTEADEQSSVLAWIDSGAPLFRDHGPFPPRHLAVYFAVLDPVRRTVLQPVAVCCARHREERVPLGEPVSQNDLPPPQYGASQRVPQRRDGRYRARVSQRDVS